MLTPEQRAAGWIEHNGGPCPVPMDSKPAIMCRGGQISNSGPVEASYWSGAPDDWWKHEDYTFDHKCDIIAYLPETSHDQ